MVVTERRRHKILGPGHVSKAREAKGRRDLYVVESVTSVTETECWPSTKGGLVTSMLRT